MTIRNRIILQSLVFLFISALITNGFLLFTSYQTLQASSQDKAGNLVGDHAQAIENSLGSQISSLKTWGATIEASLARKLPLSPEVMKDYLNREMGSNPEIIGGGWFVSSDGTPTNRGTSGYLTRGQGNELSQEKKAFFSGLSQLSLSSHFEKTEYNEPFISIFQPLKSPSGSLGGGVFIDLSLKSFQKLLSENTPFDGGYFSLFDAQGVYLFHPKSTHLGQNFRKMDQFSGAGQDSPEVIIDTLQKGQSLPLVKFSKSSGTSVLRYYHPIMVEKTMALTLAVSLPVSSLTAPFFAQIGFTLALLLVLFSINAVILIPLLAFTLGPLKTLKSRVTDWTSGNADLTLTLDEGEKNEVGEVSRALNVFRENLRQIIISLQDQSQALESLSSHLSTLSQHSASATEQMAAASTQAAQASERQLEQTEATRASIEKILVRIERNHTLTQEMSKEIEHFHQSLTAGRVRNQQCFDQVKHTEGLVVQLHQTGEQGKLSMVSLRNSVGEVSQRAGEIQKIVSFILDISDRTNLLSMNAAIEAARAGTSGRGFAVVAGEIRKLAESSSQQAQSIKALLEGISFAVDQTLEQTQKADLTFERLHQDIGFVRNSSQEITKVMEAQNKFDQELDGGLSQFIRFTNQLADTMNNNVQESRLIKTELETLQSSAMEIRQAMVEQKVGMEETASAALRVQETATDMRHIVGSIHDKIDQFKT